MVRFVQRSLVAAVMLTMSGMAMADTTTVDLSSGLSNAPGSSVGWDADKAAPGGAPGTPAGFGNNSMFVSVPNGDYQTLRVFIPALFGHSVKLADLASFSFDTFGDDAYAIIYMSGFTDKVSWYSGRYMAQAGNLSDPNWQINASNVPGSLTFYDTTVTNANPNPFDGSIPLVPQTYSQIQGLNANDIMWIDFKIGASPLNGGIGAQTGQLDALSFTLSDGTNKTLDLAVVPVPAAAWSGLSVLGLLGVGALRRRKGQTA